MKPTLVILAAGMASRYDSLKQIEGISKLVKNGTYPLNLWNDLT
jgi:CTP:molybdopterin cytidylyltransferase MocA